MIKSKRRLGLLLMAVIGFLLVQCGEGMDGGAEGNSDDRSVLTAGVSPVTVEAGDSKTDDATVVDSTKVVFFTGAAELPLTKADFGVTGGGAVGSVSVVDDKVTIIVTFEPNPPSVKVYDVVIANTSEIVRGDASVKVIHKGADGSNRILLTAGEPVEVSAAETTATVTFTAGEELTFTPDLEDFTVAGGGTVTDVSVEDNTVTVTVDFPPNIVKGAATAPKTYTVSVAADSEIVMGSGSVTITQLGANIQATLYVSGTGSDENDGQPDRPFKTLAYAYTAALAAPVHKMIVVLSDLDAGSAAMTLNGGGTPITITSDGGLWTLTRTTGVNDSVVKVTGGAKVVFWDIVINGRPKKDDPSENVYHRALLVQGSETSVTLDNTELTGKVSGTNVGGGGVSVDKGSLTMNSGSTVSGSKAYYGGGVYVDGGSLTMNSGSTVSGNDSRTGGVYVKGNGSTLTMSGNSKISNNSSFLEAAGVYLRDGVFTMSGTSEISENWFRDSKDWSSMEASGSIGGGVSVRSNGVLTMSGNSKIRNNRATLGDHAAGGGVYLENGSLTMSGNSEISGNTANKDGGGVCLTTGNVTMSGNSKIRNNKVVRGVGGGVSVMSFLSSSSFTMSGNSEISENTASAGGGGGVYFSAGVFTMSGNSTIRGNRTISDGILQGTQYASNVIDTKIKANWNGGGGVYFDNYAGLSSRNFTMKDTSTISGNTAGQDSWGNGGGVYYNGDNDAYQYSYFTMEGGTISGNTATSSDAEGGYGSGVYFGTTTPPGVFDITGGTISGNTGRAGTADFYRVDTE